VTAARVAIVSALAAPALATAAAACPLCVSDTGRQIRAMMAADPAWHLGVTLAPIPVLIAVVLLVRFATPLLVGDRS
jgi:hypothetical protein